VILSTNSLKREGLTGMSVAAVEGAGGQIKPQVFAIYQSRQADPLDHGILIPTQLEHRVGGSPVEKVDAAALPPALEKESANAMTGDTNQVVIAAAQGEADQLDQPFVAACQMPAEPQEPLAMLAEGIQTDRDRPSIRPKNLIALKMNIAALTVPRGITTKQNGQAARHRRLLGQATRGCQKEAGVKKPHATRIIKNGLRSKEATATGQTYIAQRLLQFISIVIALSMI
jgi:hypothetical protein